MIGTEQERAALMAAIVEYGDQRQVFGFAAARNDGDRVGLATITADQIFAAIRAMLVPDDAVVIPRELARSVYSALAMAKGDIAKSNAAAILEILQPEATR